MTTFMGFIIEKILAKGYISKSQQKIHTNQANISDAWSSACQTYFDFFYMYTPVTYE